MADETKAVEALSTTTSSVRKRKQSSDVNGVQKAPHRKRRKGNGGPKAVVQSTDDSVKVLEGADPTAVISDKSDGGVQATKRLLKDDTAGLAALTAGTTALDEEGRARRRAAKKQRLLAEKAGETGKTEMHRAKKARRRSRGNKVMQEPTVAEPTGVAEVHINASPTVRKTVQVTEGQEAKVSKKSSQVASAVVKAEPKRSLSKSRSKRTSIIKRAEKTAWNLSPVFGGRYIDHDPLFITDSKGDDFIVAATPTKIQLLSVDSSLPVASHEVTASAIIAFAQGGGDGLSKIELLTEGGELSVWDWEKGVLTEKETLAADATAFSVLSSAEGDGNQTHRIFAISRDGASALYYDTTEIHNTKLDLVDVTTLDNGRYVVANSPEHIVIGRRKSASTDFGDMTWIEMPTSGHISSFHAVLGQSSKPKGIPPLRLAVGLEGGRIYLYDDLNALFDAGNNGKDLSPRLLHWHRDDVNSVKFSEDGNYLISGGKETVLVLWQLETGKKQFLPHLTSEIERIVISPRGDRYALQMGDNSIMVLSTSELKPVANFAGLQMPVQQSAAIGSLNILYPPAAILHPQSPDHLLLTVPSTQPRSEDDIVSRPFLQTFDLQTSRHISRQALTRNNVTDFNLGPDFTPIVPPDVTDIAISPDGQWLATTDDWFPPENDLAHLAASAEQLDEQQRWRRESYLKFWHWDAATQLWTLTTRVDAPHKRASAKLPGAGEVLALVADPSATGFATVGEDSSVRMWKSKIRVRQATSASDKQPVAEQEWTCRRVVELERQMPRVDSPIADLDDDALQAPSTATLAYSEDGSILAVCFKYDSATADPVVHFINAATGQVKSSNTSLVVKEPLSSGFLDRYYISLCSSHVRVWDMVRYEAKFTFPVFGGTDDGENPPLLAINKEEQTFALFTPATEFGAGEDRKSHPARVRIFTLESAVPVHTEDLDMPVAALLAGRGRRGYVLLNADATTVTLTSTRGAFKALKNSAVEPTTSISSMEIPDLAAEAKHGPTAIDAADNQMVEEDDRAVVRPEQLARVFEEGAGQGLREMWRAVAELYGRKPIREGESVAIKRNGDAMEID